MGWTGEVVIGMVSGDVIAVKALKYSDNCLE